jgi:hypothetical protein
MKNYLLGFFTFFCLNVTTHYLWVKHLDLNNDCLASFYYNLNAKLDGTGVVHVITGRCKTKKQIEYFDCSKVQIFLSNLIYGVENEQKEIN